MKLLEITAASTLRVEHKAGVKLVNSTHRSTRVLVCELIHASGEGTA